MFLRQTLGSGAAPQLYALALVVDGAAARGNGCLCGSQWLVWWESIAASQRALWKSSSLPLPKAMVSARHHPWPLGSSTILHGTVGPASQVGQVTLVTRIMVGR